MNKQQQDALEVLDGALSGVNPAGWGAPNDFTDQGWTDERYEEAWLRAMSLVQQMWKEEPLLPLVAAAKAVVDAERELQEHGWAPTMLEDVNEMARVLGVEPVEYEDPFADDNEEDQS